MRLLFGAVFALVAVLCGPVPLAFADPEPYCPPGEADERQFGFSPEVFQTQERVAPTVACQSLRAGELGEHASDSSATGPDATEQPRLALPAEFVSQRPDPNGCLLAATATVVNLLRGARGEHARLAYTDAWLEYDQLVPGFAGDAWTYPQPWELDGLVQRLGSLTASATQTFSPADTETWLLQGLHPIVYLGGSATTPAHAVVLLEQDAERVRFFDPWDGLRAAPRSAFYDALGPWATVIHPVPR